MAESHMTEADVSRDFSAVMRKVGSGEVIVVDRNGVPFAVIEPAEQEPLTLSELLDLAVQREHERGGKKITLDEDYGAEVEQIVKERKQWVPVDWE